MTEASSHRDARPARRGVRDRAHAPADGPAGDVGDRGAPTPGGVLARADRVPGRGDTPGGGDAAGGDAAGGDSDGGRGGRPASPGRRRALVAGAVALAGGGAGVVGWRTVSGGGDPAVTAPAPPPRRSESVSAADAGGFGDRDESFAASVGEAAPAPAPAPPTLVYPTASEAAAAAEATVPTILATDNPGAHLLRRATFGPTEAVVADVGSRGIDAWLAGQLDPSSIPDDVADLVWAMFPLAGSSPSEVRASTEKFGWDAMYEYGQATLARQIWSERQLFEVMVDFWANHLNVATPNETAWDVGPSWHNDVIRTHALGTFTDMLLDANRHPAMLKYLTNDSSVKDDVNENLGRELLELHTVGVGSGYTEGDVRNSAYILTGRTVFSEMNDRGGTWNEFTYDPATHWTGPVTVLGFSHPNDSADGGLEVGDEYLRYLATHPSTAQTIARKLAVRLVSDSPPPELVDRMAATYLESGTAIVPVLDVMFRSVEFWAAVGQKTRRPLENLVATVRVVGALPGPDTRSAVEGMYWTASEMGHLPLAWPAPNGYPDVQAAWTSISGMLMLWNHHRAQVQGGGEALTYTPPDRLIGDRPRATLGDYVDGLCDRLCFQPFLPAHRDALLAFMGTGAATPVDQLDMGMIAHLAPLVLDSPYFALR